MRTCGWCTAVTEACTYSLALQTAAPTTYSYLVPASDTALRSACTVVQLVVHQLSCAGPVVVSFMLVLWLICGARADVLDLKALTPSLAA
jgi:hypothetical protein